ncbi:hypothetical protein C8J57DRAFT_1596811 [Mycena rebaudengoi]|nr:hypothetical protein C8J57DRAFT_1596811 [Mycena rebaudengoi]
MSTTKSRESPEASSRPSRTLKKRDTNASTPPTSVRTSKGNFGSLRRLRTLGRVGNEKIAAESIPSSSQTPLNAPEDPPEPAVSPKESSPELSELSGIITAAVGAQDLSLDTEAVSKQPEPTFLAQKILALINALPTLSSRFITSPKDPPAVPTGVIVDSDGCPIPPPGATRIQDPELISLLSSSSIMNGSEGRRHSVWSMLDSIPPPRLRNAGNNEYAGSDRSSIMMYSPLIPMADSVVELAESSAVPVAPGGASPGSWWPWNYAWSLVWPFGGWKAAPEPELVPEPVSTPEPTPQVVAIERRVWVPSTTQLSFETMWWGYRIYLPPPVLAVLDDQSVEAAKQTTTITAALTWFFSNLPVATFPPPVQPAMLLLQRLIPLVAYLGSFITWSWSTIRGFDQGHGVILTATWILPIALIPGTWHARDFPPLPTLDSASETFMMVTESSSMPAAVVSKPLPPTPASSSSTEAPTSSSSAKEGSAPATRPANERNPPSTLHKSKNKTMSTLRKLTRTNT